MNVFTNYLEKLGSNFLVSAMVPSLAFVLTSILVFDPILKIAAAFQNPLGAYQLIGIGLIVFIFTVIIGFTLTALNTYFLKMFEGYVTPLPIRFLYKRGQRIHRLKAYNLIADQDKLKNEILHLQEQEGLSPKLEGRLETLKDEYYMSVANYSLQYPLDPKDVLPSRFGNTLKAAENYSGDRYGIDGVHFWPRMVHVIPTDYKLSIDNTRNELSFLVNMSILSVSFSSLCVLATFYFMWTANPVGGDPAVVVEFFSRVTKYLIAAAFGFLSFGFFYNASIFSVGSFGLMIRSSFDLFRMDLLRKLELKRPKDSIEEFDAWQSLNELIVLGSRSLTYKKIDYREEE
jgi:hypothetical protein